MRLTKRAKNLKNGERLCKRCAGCGFWVEKEQICFRCHGSGVEDIQANAPEYVRMK